MKDRDQQLIDAVLDLASEFSENEFEKFIASFKALGYRLERIKEILDKAWGEKS